MNARFLGTALALSSTLMLAGCFSDVDPGFTGHSISVSESPTSSALAPDPTGGRPTAAKQHASASAKATITSSVAPSVVHPRSFLVPDFTDMDENEVESWLDDHSIVVQANFDYGDDEDTECSDAGDGVVDSQSPDAGSRLANTDANILDFEVSCDY